MSNKRTIRKVAMTRKGQVWLSAEGVDAAIAAYKCAIALDGRTDSVIRESVCLADFAREVGREAAAVNAYRETLALCLWGERAYASRFRRCAYHCAMMIDNLLDDRECTEVDRVLDFFNSAEKHY